MLHESLVGGRADVRGVSIVTGGKIEAGRRYRRDAGYLRSRSGIPYWG